MRCVHGMSVTTQDYGRAHSRVHQVCHVIVGFHVLCAGLVSHVVIGVGRLTVQQEGFIRQLHFHHAYAIPSTQFFSSGCCSPTSSCHRQLKLYSKFLHISHRENGSFEVLSFHGITDPELVFGFHSSHVVMCGLIH